MVNENKLKPGWRRVKFGDVVRQSKLKADPLASGLERYIGGEHMDTDDLRIRRWGEIGAGYLGPAFHMHFKPGQVLYGSRRTYLRKVAVPDFEGICANTTFVLESKDNGVLLPEFLPFLMQTDAFHEYSITNSKGSVNPYINFSDLADFEFALPSLEEQANSINFLIELGVVKDVTYDVIKSVIGLREALANNFWNGGHGWAEIMLGTVCKKIQDGTHFSPKTTSGRFRYVTSKNIKDGYLDLADCGWISESEHEEIFKRCDVRQGDILITKDGANTGNVAINELAEPFSLLSSVAFLRPNENLNNRYLFEFLRSSFGNRRVVSKKGGTAIPRVTLRQIKSIHIPLAPLETQLTLADSFSNIEATLLMVKQRFTKINELYVAAIKQLSLGANNV